jgi:hypothetical protein
MPTISQHLEPKTTCCPNCRSPSRLVEVLASLDVENSPRYRVRDTTGDGKPDTFCNIFVWDATRALGCELEHWWNGKELSANGLCDWLANVGTHYGWTEVSDFGAALAVVKGKPVVAAWRNPKGTGHVAMVLPPGEGGALRIAQAGKRNLFDVELTKGFGVHVPRFYMHD